AEQALQQAHAVRKPGGTGETESDGSLLHGPVSVKTKSRPATAAGYAAGAVLAGKGAMADQNTGLALEMFLEPLCQIDGTMLATGTADGDGEITAVVGDIAW